MAPTLFEATIYLVKEGTMIHYQEQLVKMMVDMQALTFGDFTLKSGRKSPFFINTGKFQDGKTSRELADCYAQAINETFGAGNFDVVFGPAYKGIPLAVSTAIEFYHRYNLNVRWCSNRKEEKDHGDGGTMLGYQLQDGDRVVLIDDVMTSGSSIREAIPLLKAQASVEIVGVMVSVDRHEQGLRTERTALEEIGEEFGIRTGAIVTMPEAAKYLFDEGVLSQEQLMRIDHYYSLYGPIENARYGPFIGSWS